jgi:hypothetical protein
MIFIRNYFYELPDDIQTNIYKLVFNSCISDIEKDKNIKYISRLYNANNNPSNTCVFSIKPKWLINNRYIKEEIDYKYKKVAYLENYKNNINELLYLDREHLIYDTSYLDIYTISYFLYPLSNTRATFKKYLTVCFNLFEYYDKNMIKYIKVIGDKVNITFIHKFKCYADIYYNIQVGYNILYNLLSNIIYTEQNIKKYAKFVLLFRWIENNAVLENCIIDNNIIIPIFEGKFSKN